MVRPDLERPTIEEAARISQGVMAMPKPWVHPIDICNAVLFLASDEARYITGATLAIHLGQLARMLCANSIALLSWVTRDNARFHTRHPVGERVKRLLG
jgi:hypothetical protein